MLNNSDKDIIRKIIRDIVSKEIEKLEKKLEDKRKETINKTNQQFLKQLNKEIEALKKQNLTKEDIKKMLVKAFTQQNKFMYEKSHIITQFINNI